MLRECWCVDHAMQDAMMIAALAGATWTWTLTQKPTGGLPDLDSKHGFKKHSINSV